MKLRDLFNDDARMDPQARGVEVAGLSADSRSVKPGDLFFALAGLKTDGARFVEQAILAGAVAVAGDHPPTGGCRVPFVATANPRRALASGAAVISADHECSQQVIDVAREKKLRLITVGHKGEGTGEGIRVIASCIDGFAQQLELDHLGRKYSVRLPLVGEFQIENAVVAAGLAIGTDSDPGDVFAALEHLEGARGRLERVGEHNGAPIFVDYAHKPDALAKALQALRPYAERKLVVVIGAGGDRDAGKRPLMGAIAAENADHVIVTDDNPRSENPATIRAEILASAKGAVEIGDRNEAIRAAIAGLRGGDVLLIAGKGHETGQIVGDRVLPFSDHDAVASALSETVA